MSVKSFSFYQENLKNSPIMFDKKLLAFKRDTFHSCNELIPREDWNFIVTLILFSIKINFAVAIVTSQCIHTERNDVERIIISFGINMLHMWSDVDEKFFHIFSHVFRAFPFRRLQHGPGFLKQSETEI